jgi:signal transduction histidine kinase
MTGPDSKPTPPTVPPEIAGLMLRALPGVTMLVDADLRIHCRQDDGQTPLPAADHLVDALPEVRHLSEFDGWAQEIAQVIETGEVGRHRLAVTLGADQSFALFDVTCTRLYVDGEPLVCVRLAPTPHADDLVQRLAVAERLAAVGKLAARVAHELNNPLDGILRFIGLAVRLLPEGHDPKLSSYLEESRIGLRRMAQIVRELLEFSRTTHGEFDLAPINTVVEQAMNALTEPAAARRIVVAADFQTQDLPSVRGPRLYQVCCNLIKNAIDAMPEGGRLTLSTGMVNDEVVIRMTDTGPGLPDPPDAVFEAFYTTKPPGEGTGLGLAICRDFIEAMGGTITATNPEAGGACFIIRLPRSALIEAGAPGQELASPTPAPGKPRILTSAGASRAASEITVRGTA